MPVSRLASRRKKFRPIPGPTSHRQNLRRKHRSRICRSRSRLRRRSCRSKTRRRKARPALHPNSRPDGFSDSPMRSIEDRLAELEGRIIAHRRLLARIVDGLDADQRKELMRWIDDREVLRDGQEDPGAVPTGAETLPLSMAEEYQQIAALVGGAERS